MPLEMKVTRLSPACAVVALDGGLTLGMSLKSTEGDIQQLISDGVLHLVIDLAGCGYSDSAGLGFLVYTYGIIAQKGGAVRLCRVPARLREMLINTRTDAILPCDASPAESLQKLSEAPAGPFPT